MTGFGAFGHLLAAGGEGEGAHEALEGTEAVGEIGRALGDALEQFGVSGVVGVGGDERFVLRTEFHGDSGDLLAEEDEELAEIFERDGGFLVEKLFEQPLHGGVAPLEVGKREEVAHEGEEIVAAHLLQLVGRGLLLGNVLGELEHGAVLDDGRGGNGGAEHQAFERLATREGNVGLPVGRKRLCTSMMARSKVRPWLLCTVMAQAGRRGYCVKVPSTTSSISLVRSLRT